MQPFNNVMRTFALAGLFAVLGGCSEYLDRRDTIAKSGGNAVATNIVTQMVDPWPPESANRNIAFNGPRDGKRVRALPHQSRHCAARHWHVELVPGLGPGWRAE